MPTVRKQTANRRSKISKKKSVVDRITKMGEEEEFIKINVYGRSGSGKTTFWSTFPKPILAVLCSGGQKPGELKSINTPANRKVIDRVTLNSSSEINELAEMQRETGKYKTIVLDHASGLQDFVLREVLELDEVPAQLSWGLATQQQYGQVALQMKERLRTFLNLDCNVVIVAQEREFNVDSDSASLLLPSVGSALTPSITGWLNPACDYIVQTFIREEQKESKTKIGGKEKTLQRGTGKAEFCLRTAPDPVYTTKFRLPKGVHLPQVIVNPDYNKVIELIKQ